MAFYRVVAKFKETGTVQIQKSPGPSKTKIMEENITTIMNLIEDNPSTSIRQTSSELDISY